MPHQHASDELDLDTFLDMVPDLGRNELLTISAKLADGDVQAIDGARARAARVADVLGMTGDLDRLRGSIGQWASADIPRSNTFTMAYPNDPILGDLRVQAVPALIDAATVLLLGEALDEADRDLLLGPLWAAQPDA